MHTFVCDGKGNFKGFKVVAQVNFPISACMGLLKDSSRFLEYNPPIESMEVLKEIGSRSFVHVVAKGMMFVAS